MFSFGIGTDINTHLLDRVASETKAFSQYVLPEEDIELKVSSFYTKIKEPALANVTLDFTGGNVRVSEVYPSAMPDLYKGQTLVAFGRYRGDGAGAVRVAGTLAGERREFADDVTFTADDTRHAFIPRLWATRRVGWLLDEIRLRGESTELRDEVVRLAREHGIVTPYTAYLILEDEARRNVPLSSRTFRELEEDALARSAVSGQYHSAAADSAALEKSGPRAVQNAQAAQQLQHSLNEAQARQELAMAKRGRGAYPGGYGGGYPGAAAGAGAPATAQPSTQPADLGYHARTNYAQQVRIVRGKTFYQNGPTWTDAALQSKPNLRQQSVAFNSDDYFALVRQYPDAAQWLSLGNEVDLVIVDTLYQVR